MHFIFELLGRGKLVLAVSPGINRLLEKLDCRLESLLVLKAISAWSRVFVDVHCGLGG